MRHLTAQVVSFVEVWLRRLLLIRQISSGASSSSSCRDPSIRTPVSGRPGVEAGQWHEAKKPGCATSPPRWRSRRPGTCRRSELVGSRRRQASDHAAERSGALLGPGGLGRSGLASSLIGLGSLTFSSRCGLWGRESYARAVRQVRRTQRSEPGPLDDPEGRPSRRHLGDVPAVITREHREASTRPDRAPLLR